MDLHIGQRVKFIDPDEFDPRIGTAPEARGRIVYLLGRLAQVISDGKAFGIWLRVDDLQLE